MAQIRYYNAVIIILAAIILPSFFYSSSVEAESQYEVNITAIVAAPESPPEPPPPAPSGGGGGAAIMPIVLPTSIQFKGRAYPSSKVVLMRDARIVKSVEAGEDSFFDISLTDMEAGNYIFSIYAEDKDGVRSKTSTFPISVVKNANTIVSGIFIVPTLSVDKKTVKPGDTIRFFGQSFPGSELTISVNSAETQYIKTMTDKSGVYFINFDTSVLAKGSHTAKSKSAVAGAISEYGSAVSFQVGEDKPVSSTIKGDLNGDGKVNLIDFSIAAFWYKKPNPPERLDVKKDGIIDLIDFSIMTFYWTG